MNTAPPRTFRSLLQRLPGDESGAIMVEYIIMVGMLALAFMWLNRAADTVLFGANPYNTRGGFAHIAPEELSPEARAHFESIAGRPGQGDTIQSENDDRAYLSQVYIHLSRP